MVDTGPVLGNDLVVLCAYATAIAWMDRGAADRHWRAGDRTVLGQGDPNLANFLWDGTQIRLVDFEDSGPSDRAAAPGRLVLADHAPARRTVEHA